MMKFSALALVAFVCTIAFEDAQAQTKSEKCAAYARNAAASTPTSTGLARGAARGAVVGAISGNAGRGAAIGATVGGTRRVVQRSRSYEYYYTNCMKS